MSRPNEAQLKWLETAGIVGAGVLAEILTHESNSNTPVTLPGRVSRADTSGLPDSDSSRRSSTSPNFAGGGKPTPKPFVPDLEVVGGPRHQLAVGGNVALQLRVRNWDKRPPGTVLDWSVDAQTSVVDFRLNREGGEVTVTVTGLKAGQAVIKADVKGNDGRTHKFPELLFAVSAMASNASMFVPDLAPPEVSKQNLVVGEEVTLRLKVRNWDKRPKGTIVDWSVSSSGNALDQNLDRQGGEGTVTLKGLNAGQQTIKVELKVKDGGTYPFADTTFSVVDEGGLASVTDLEQDMRNILQDWRSAADDGIQQFATTELSARLDKLESGSASSFLIGLLGNTIWAAAAFTTGGAAFAISMGGIAVASVPGVPNESKSFIPTIQRAMVDHIYNIYDQLDKSLRNKAQALVDSQSGMSRFRALATFVAASFKSGYYSNDPKNARIPVLNKSAIRDLFAQEATEELESTIKAHKAAEEERRAKEYLKKTARRMPGEV